MQLKKETEPNQSESLAQGFKRGAIGRFALQTFIPPAPVSSLSGFRKKFVYIIIFPIFKRAYLINGYLLNEISVINSIHSCLTPTPTVTPVTVI